jgi:hypothetical protein
MMTDNHNQVSERAYWEPKPLFEDYLYEVSLLAVAIFTFEMSSDEDRKIASHINQQFIESIPQRLVIIEKFLQRHNVNISVEDNDYTELEHFVLDNIDPYTNPVAVYSQRNTSSGRINDLWVSLLTDIALHILYKKQELNAFPIKWHPLSLKPSHYYGYPSNEPRFSVPGPIPVKGITLINHFTNWGRHILFSYSPKHRYQRLYNRVIVIYDIVEQSGQIPLPYTKYPLRVRKPVFSIEDYEITPYVHLLRYSEQYTPEQKRKLFKQMISDIPTRNKQVEVVFQRHGISINLQSNNLEELEVFLTHHIDPHKDPELENKFMNDQWTSFMIDVALYCGNYKVKHNEGTKWKIVTRDKQPELALFSIGTRHFIFHDFLLYGDQIIDSWGKVTDLSSSISPGNRLLSYEIERHPSNVSPGGYFPTKKFAHLQ